MDVEMRHGSASSRAIVDPDVVAVGMEQRVQFCLGLHDESQEILALFVAQAEERVRVAARNHQRVPGRDRERISYDNAVAAAGHDAAVGKMTEGTVSGGVCHAHLG